MRTALKKDEKLLLITRQHWIKLVLPFFICTVISTALIWFFVEIGIYISLFLLLYPLYLLIEWKYNLWAVTNIRVIDESGFFSRHSKESPLDKINNVEYAQSFWGRLFGFGNVDIQTAAEMGETVYQLIRKPKLLKDTITHAQEEYKNAQISNQANQFAEAIAKSNPNQHYQVPPQQLIADELNKLFELMQKGGITQEEYLAQKNKLLGNIS